jgi:hypothetical protein
MLTLNQAVDKLVASRGVTKIRNLFGFSSSSIRLIRFFYQFDLSSVQ